MIPVISRNSQHIAVFGLGASGRAAAHALTAGGSTVTAWDDNADSRKEATNENIVLADPVTLDWSRQDALILSPGVPLTHPQPHPAAQAALSAGKPVIGDIELLFENVGDAKLIGITGTNGKSTTSALIQHVLHVAGLPVQIGGNFGPPVLGLDPISSDDTVVLELSSYQLDLIENAAFDIAVFLNLTPDHLDRHGDMDGYAAAKKRIFRNTRSERQIAVIGVDDDHGAAIAAELSGWPGWIVIPISAGQSPKNGVSVIDGSLSDQDRLGCDVSGIDTLRGRHNWQNAAAAWSVARALDIDRGDRSGIPDLQGVTTSARKRRHNRRHPVHQRLEGDQRRSRLTGFVLVRRYLLDRRWYRQGRQPSTCTELSGSGTARLSHRRVLPRVRSRANEAWRCLDGVRRSRRGAPGCDGGCIG